MSAFFDTNILLYAQETGAKANRARTVLALGGKVSVQVLNEFAAVSHRKQSKDWAEISEAIEDVLALVTPLALTLDMHSAALILARDHSFSFYDALTVVAAIEADCDVLYSEDMQHGRIIGNLTIRNPFLD